MFHHAFAGDLGEPLDDQIDIGTLEAQLNVLRRVGAPRAGRNHRARGSPGKRRRGGAGRRILGQAGGQCEQCGQQREAGGRQEVNGVVLKFHNAI